ncbi:hypothetical protein NTGHW29_280032 [Candidatus Nitrotoga sp. HW29]|nr:hypothetical protein NTGHW29_280032 [Candidatus Nitrotoga sp. HW29]
MQKTILLKYNNMFIFNFFKSCDAKVSAPYVALLTLFSKLDIMPSFYRVYPLRRGRHPMSM